MLMVSGPEKDEERKQSMILNKNTIESWNHSPLIGFRDQGRRCGGLQSQTTCVGVFFLLDWFGRSPQDCRFCCNKQFQRLGHF